MDFWASTFAHCRRVERSVLMGFLSLGLERRE
nr:MAG TPA: hypothetical protein [Caudoviricetes sp.]